MSDGERSEFPRRVAEMVARFRVIGEKNMRGLPVYNENLEVEAIGFRAVGEEWCGILITPWFMNVILLPQDKMTMNYSMIASPTDETLPSGTWQFMYGGDDVIGLYKSLSLHSPMFAFKTQTLAQIEAERRLHSLLTSPRPQGAERSPRGGAENRGRRYFLRGHAAS